MTDCDVVVVGAGLAGLAAARHLAASGLSVRVLEGSDGVGGRVRSERIDGITVDRGFQLLNPAYPEARRVLDLEALALQPFEPGVLLATADRRTLVVDPRRRLGALLPTALHAPGSRSDQLRFAAYATRVLRTDPRALRDAVDSTVGEAWAPFGSLTTDALAPFLTGVLFDGSMTTSRRFVDLLLRSFVRGTPAVPAAGMQAMPDQLARGLDVRPGTPVRSVTATTATTDDGGVTARAVVVATDPVTAELLLPGLDVPEMRSGTTWWHLADVPGEALTGGRGVLVLDPQRRGPVVNTVVVSNAAPAYADGSRTLVATTALGLETSEDDVRAHLALLHGVDTRRWDTVAVHRIAGTVPAVPAGTPLRQPVRHGDVFVAGDHRDTASIQGALVSGRRTAASVLTALA
ncbi:MAG: FAD-dependent oxidoreductase [Candidatus Nanopelagicales bacterium]